MEVVFTIIQWLGGVNKLCANYSHCAHAQWKANCRFTSCESSYIMRDDFIFGDHRKHIEIEKNK